MSTPEFGEVSLQVYDQQKKYLVQPDRLCVGGLYSLMLFLGPDSSPEAFTIPHRVTAVNRVADEKLNNPPNGVLPVQLNSGAYEVAAYCEWPDEPIDNQTMYFDPDGYLILPLDASPSSGYLKHRFDGIDGELEQLSENIVKPLSA